MAITCPTGFDAKRLRTEVSAMYARVAAEPSGAFHFHRGPAYAAEFLGYDAAELARLPPTATESFAGVGNPLAIDALGASDVVVDVGSGSGMDLLLAARRGRRAIGVDLTPAMLAKARQGIWLAEQTNVELRQGDAEQLPVADGEADAVISNGVLNLTTDKERAFKELRRALKPGGRLLLADIVVEAELSEGIRSDIDLWAA